MSKKFLRTAGKIAGVVAAVAAIGTGIGAVLGGTMLLTIGGAAISASAIASAAGMLSVGMSMLGKPSSPKIGAANEDRLNLSINVRRARVMAFGSTALDTDLRDQEFTGANKEFLHRFVVVAAHKVSAIREIWFDDQLAWTSGGGVQGSFAGYLQVTPVLEGSPANAINIGSRMGSSRRFTGCAYVYLRFKLTGNSKKTESPFAQQVPTRITIEGDGAPCYDVRQDSTRGGSGAHRADDQSTWTWGEHARNPACQLATWLLGWRIQNPQNLTWKLSVGAGVPADRLDWASFLEAANLCDEPVALAAGGTEPRYRAGGLVDEDDGPTAIVEQFKACMNADLDDQDGLLRLTVFHNDLATPDADFTEADVQDEYVWLQTPALNDSFNIVRGNYIEPASLYQAAPYRDAEVDSPDGIDRVHPADFGLVQSRGQAERLAKQRLQRQLYGGEFRATFLATGWKVQKNSVVRLSFAPEGWVNKLFRVADIEVRHDGLVPMVLREEHAQIYAWDAEESPAVELAEPTEYLPGDAPIPQFLGTIEEGATVGATLPDVDGTGGNIKDTGGAPIAPGLIRNDLLELQGDGRYLSLVYKPTDGSPAVVLAQLTPPDLGAARDASLADAENALERLGAAVVQLQQLASETRAIMRDAGISVDPATGQVHLHAFDRSEERLNTVDVRLDAVNAQILLRATTSYVDNAIATAVLDPSQVPVFSTLEARITTAEADIDGLQGTVSLLATNVTVNALEARVTTAETDINALEAVVSTKVSTATFDALETRVDAAETTLSAFDGASISSTVRAAKLLTDDAEDQAASTLAALLSGDRAKRQQVAAIAEARQEITAKIVDDVSAEATARQALAARVAAAEASIVTEQITRAAQDGALAASLSSVSTTVAGHTASIASVQASLNGVLAKAGVRLDVNGRITGWEAINNGSSGNFTVLADVFSVIDPDGGPSMTWANGILWNKGATTSIILGQDFGTTGDLLMWAGPNPASAAAADKADATFWIDNAGNAFFGGFVGALDMTSARLSAVVPADAGPTYVPLSSTVLTLLPSAPEVRLLAAPTSYAWGTGTGQNITYNLKWQYSLDKVAWTDVPGANSTSTNMGSSSGFPSPQPGAAAQGTVAVTVGTMVHFRVVYNITAGAEYLASPRSFNIWADASADGSST